MEQKFVVNRLEKWWKFHIKMSEIYNVCIIANKSQDIIDVFWRFESNKTSSSLWAEGTVEFVIFILSHDMIIYKYYLMMIMNDHKPSNDDHEPSDVIMIPLMIDWMFHHVRS